jgi:hypothetical protein
MFIHLFIYSFMVTAKWTLTTCEQIVDTYQCNSDVLFDTCAFYGYSCKTKCSKLESGSCDINDRSEDCFLLLKIPSSSGEDTCMDKVGYDSV